MSRDHIKPKINTKKQPKVHYVVGLLIAIVAIAFLVETQAKQSSLKKVNQNFALEQLTALTIQLQNCPKETKYSNGGILKPSIRSVPQILAVALEENLIPITDTPRILKVYKENEIYYDIALNKWAAK